MWCFVRGDASQGARERVHFVHGDTGSQTDLEAAIRESGCQCVVNLAGCYAWWLADPSQFGAANVQATANILAAVKAAGVALVHVSTVLAYGRPVGATDSTLGLSEESAFREDASPGPTTSLYASSKQAGDELVRQALSQGIKGCICYLACCVGADPKLLSEEKDVMRIRDLVEG